MPAVPSRPAAHEVVHSLPQRWAPGSLPPPRPPKSRKTKRLIVAAVTAVIGIPVIWIGWNTYQISRPPHAVSCAKALSYIGWKLPEHTIDHQCTEDVDVFSSRMSGAFRMPRTDARPWLASLPGERFGTAGAEADGVVVTKDSFHLAVNKPRHPQVDEARVEVRFEDKGTALVTFETFDY